MDSVAILFKAYVNRTIQVYEEKGMTDDQVQNVFLLDQVYYVARAFSSSTDLCDPVVL